MEKIGLFGGSFDPVHDGHVHIAHAAIEAAGLDSLVFIPCRQSPHKIRSTQASAEQRLEMLQLALADWPAVSIDDLELTRPAPSYSWQTVLTYRERFPTAQLFWLLGTDQWLALPRWARPDVLAQELTFIVCQRGDASLPTHEGFAPPIVIRGDHPASATIIRNDIRSGESPRWLNPKVAALIAGDEIYQP